MAFTIRDLEDLIRLLDKHPAWMEALRQRMLTRDLLESPKTLRRLSTRVGKVEKALQALTESVAALAEAQRRHYEEFAAYRAETDRRFAELAEAQRRHYEEFAAHRQEFAAYRAEADRRFAELAEAQRRHYEEFAAHRQEFLVYRAETDRRFAELREEVAAARAEAAPPPPAPPQAPRRHDQEFAAHRQEFLVYRAETDRRFAELREEIAAVRTEADRRFAELAEAVRELAEAQRRTDARLEDLRGRLRGLTYENRYRTQLHRYLRLVSAPRALSPEEWVAFLEAARDAGRLSVEEVDDLGSADVIVRGRSLQGEGEVFLVVEVSATVHPEDIERAARRAALLRRALPDAEVLAVVAGPELHPRAGAVARERGVWWLKDGRPFAPHEIPVEPPPRSGDL